jgi:hypothetical protein
MLTRETIDREVAEDPGEVCGAHDRCWVSPDPMELARAGLGADWFCQIGWVRRRDAARYVLYHVDTGQRVLRDPPKVPKWDRDPATNAWRQTEPR